MFAVFTHEPQTIQIESSADLLSRLRLFLGHYDLRIYVNETQYLEVGRGSLGAALHLAGPMSKQAQCIARVGQFCDFAGTAKLFVSSEHKNDQYVNVVFTNATALLMKAAQQNIESLRPSLPEPIEIGNAVVVSAEACLYPGAKIGDGAVIAADASVLGVIEAYTIAGGLPAKTLRKRFLPEEVELLKRVRWWDFDLAYIGNNLQRIQELAVDTDARHVYRKSAPRFAIRLTQAPALQVSVVGFVENNVLKAWNNAPPRVQAYLSQIGKTGTCEWIADVWNCG